MKIIAGVTSSFRNAELTKRDLQEVDAKMVRKATKAFGDQAASFIMADISIGAAKLRHHPCEVTKIRHESENACCFVVASKDDKRCFTYSVRMPEGLTMQQVMQQALNPPSRNRSL